MSVVHGFRLVPRIKIKMHFQSKCNFLHFVKNTGQMTAVIFHNGAQENASFLNSKLNVLELLGVEKLPKKIGSDIS